MLSSLVSKLISHLVFCYQRIIRHRVTATSLTAIDSGSTRSDWSNIGSDLLEYIQKKLPPSDILKCRAVCRSWRSITKTHIKSSLNSLSTGRPLLVFCYESFGCSRRYFLDYFVNNMEENFFEINYNSDELLRKMSDCVGFSNGWFLFLDDAKQQSLCLFHPALLSISPVCCPLISAPPDNLWSFIKGSRQNSIQKAALLGDPIFGAYGVVIIHGNDKKLLYAKYGDKKFIRLENQSHYGELSTVEGDDDWSDDYREPCSVGRDIICFNNCIYGFTFTNEGRHHRIEAWDCSSSCRYAPRKILDFEPKFEIGPEERSSLHLVESEGELLLVSLQLRKLVGMKRARFHHWAFESGPDTCRVYKMDFKEKEWIQIDSVGDRTIFVMDYQTMSLPSYEFPQYQKNSIYFKLDRIGYYTNRFCVFSMETRNKEHVRIKGGW